MKALPASCFCLLALAACLAAAPAVTTNKTAYLVLEPIVVTYSGMSGDPGDYITLVPANSADNVWWEYHKTGGALSGTMNFNPLEPGDYEARVHLHNNDNVVSARYRFTVSYPNSTIATNKTAYLVLEPIVVTFSNLPGYDNDYITIVPANSSDATYWEFHKTAGVKNGTMNFTAQLDPGTYEARLHFHNDDAVVRARYRFTVSYPNSTVATDKTAYLVLEPVTVTFANLPGYPADYITVVLKSAPENTDGEWHYANAKNGTMKFTAQLEPGIYEARLHYRSEEEVVRARAAFTVSYPNSTVSTNKLNYLAGETVTVAYADLPGYPADYITIVPATSPDSTDWEWHYSDSKKNGAMNFTNRLEVGWYEARLHYRNEDTVRARARFHVGPSTCTFTLTPTSPVSYSGSGGAGTASVTAGTDCLWSASPGVPWIATTSTGSGNGTVNYSVAAHTGTSQRSGAVIVADKTFTVTQDGSAAGGQIPITNSGFELPVVSDGNWINGAMPGWMSNNAAGVGVLNPAAAMLPGGAAPEGQNAAWINAQGAYLEQVLTETLAAGVTYTLTVRVGDRADIPCCSSYAVQLLAGNIVHAEDNNTLQPADGFLLSTVTFTPSAADPQLGAPLAIRLVSLTQAAPVLFDDVRLRSDPSQPTGTTPAPQAVSPPASSGWTYPMTFSFTDPNGWQDLDVVNILVNNYLDGRSACYLAYSRPGNALYLVDDAGGSLVAGALLNVSGSIANSQCAVSWGSSPVLGSGNTLSLTLTMGFQPGFAGNRVVYMAARDVAGNNSGWHALGTCHVEGGVQNTTTAVTGMTPARGSGLTPTAFTFNFTDSKGYQDLGVVNILVNAYLDGRHACYLAYARSINVLYMVNDNGDALLPGQSLGSSGSLVNSQCTVSWGSSPVTAGGNNLSLLLTIAFSPAFGGNRVFYVAARDIQEANNTGWQAIGTWNVQ